MVQNFARIGVRYPDDLVDVKQVGREPVGHSAAENLAEVVGLCEGDRTLQKQQNVAGQATLIENVSGSLTTKLLIANPANSRIQSRTSGDKPGRR